MPIDRERFLRTALLLSLGGAPVVATGCTVVTDDAEETQAQTAQPVEQTSGGEGPVMMRSGPPDQAYAPVNEGYAPVNEGYAPVNEGYAPVNEGGPVYE